MSQVGTGAAPASAWTEPPWSGWIETTGDALLILEAARRGLIPRVTRRLVDSERKMITSGSVFVFDEDESGIKRWTDGFFWSPSRILGNFLLYRETDKRGAGHRGIRSDPPGPSDVSEHSHYNVEGVKLEGQTLSRPKHDASQHGVDKHRERTLVGSLTNSYKFKPDGLMKKTFSLTIGGVSQHLISYYKIEDVEQGRLRSPSSLPELATLDISPEYLDKTHFRNPPKVEIGLDGLPRYRGEADDIDGQDPLISPPLSSGSPVVHQENNKRKQRFDPYAAKRPRKQKNSAGHPASSNGQELQPHSPSMQHPPPGYHDPSGMHPHYPTYGMPAYYQLPGYSVPPPPPLMYPASPYPGSAPPTNTSSSGEEPSHSPQSPPLPPPSNFAPQGSPQPPPQYAFTGYGSPNGNADTTQPGLPGQPNYYPYYPPAPGAYPGYQGMGGYSYPAYPPPQVSTQTPGDAQDETKTLPPTDAPTVVAETADASTS